MPRLGYHASHEQFPPSELLECVEAAEAAGFSAAMCSDHFHPWLDAQGHSGFAWAWLGAALQATTFPIGVVNAPGWRYHPAIIAQGAATLAEMYPGRFWLAAGSGEALNEHIIGEYWPAKSERNARLQESLDVIRALWRGETVTHRGRICVDEARLYTLPDAPPLIIGAAVTAETAHWVGGWADGLITVSKPADDLEALLEAFWRGGGEGKPLMLQAKVSYARDEREAREGAHEQWRANIFGSDVLATLTTPAQFEAVGQYVTASDVEHHVHISSDLERHAQWLMEYLELGFDEIYIHNVNRRQREFITAFGEHVLPALAHV